MGEEMTPLVLGFLFLLVTLARSYWLWRTVGVNPYVIDHHDPIHRLVVQVFGVVIVGLLAYFGAIALEPAAEARMGLLGWAAGGTMRWIGTAMMAVAVMWTGYAQFAMGNSWRIGIPSEAPPLRTDGPFALSRNPIFLGMLIFVAGMAVWSPSAVTLALLAASYVVLEVQIRSEELFLERMHGETYRAYRERVRRWL